MDKTVNVAVVRSHLHEKYHRRLNYTRRFLAHDDKEECKVGDFVRIAPCRKLSARKHFIVQEILKRAPQIDAQLNPDEMLENTKIGRNVMPL